MANLAIKGHPTRGSEVIALLEMLGGKNIYNLTGTKEIWYILSDGTIEHSTYIFDEKRFALEEFLEKFPYKVGDKVTHDMGILMNVVHMCWDAECNVIRYDIQSPVDNNYKLKAMLAEHLQPYKEETMEEGDKAMAPTLVGEDYSGKRFGYKIQQGYEFDCIQNNEIIIKPIKPQYPKTYEECCEILDILGNINIEGYKEELLLSLQQLLICRDAYWKIVGEQMELGKPWEPDWLNVEQDKYVLYTHNNAICSNRYVLGHNILAFPIAEMRDAFYENFKELIESCKELL